MQNANNLNTSINTLNSGEAAALADINRRTTDAQNTYNSGLASANAQIEADYIKNLLDQRNKELDRQLQEKQFNESVRQFNENLALQKQQLYSRFSGGSGGGRSSRKTTSKTKTTSNSSVPKGYKATNYTADMPTGKSSSMPNKVVAGMTFATTPLYQKGNSLYYQAANGKMTKVSTSKKSSKKKK